METKEEAVRKYSNPAKVKKRMKQLLGKDTELFFSTRKNNKYMIKSPDDKWLHFGAFNPPMEDFTKHQDEERRKKFQIRNARWKDTPKWSASWLSYHLLW